MVLLGPCDIAAGLVARGVVFSPVRIGIGFWGGRGEREGSAAGRPPVS
jgi:hypothetical protein